MIQVGTVLRNNESGVNVRVLEITGEIRDGQSYPKYAVYHTGKRRAKIRLDRIFDDGRHDRKRGYNVVTTPDVAVRGSSALQAAFDTTIGYKA